MLTASRALVICASGLSFGISNTVLAELPAHPVVETFGSTPEELIPPGSQSWQGLEFGYAVAVRDTQALMGMPTIDADRGSVAVFTRDASLRWQRTHTLYASDQTSVTRFGRSLALRDNIAVVGAVNAAYVFRRDSNGWTQLFKLTQPAQDAPRDFGSTVRYQDGMVVVGAPDDDGAGAVYVFHIDAQSHSISRRVRLQATDARAGDRFGASVSMTRDTIVVGAPDSFREPATDSRGAAYVYRLTNGRWVQHQKLTAIDSHGNNQFGASVAVDRNMIIVGAPWQDPVGTYFGIPVDYHAGGAAYVFVPVNGRYTEHHKLRPEADSQHSYLAFGSQVAMFDRYIVVSANAADTLGTSYNPGGLGFSYVRSGTILTPRAIAHMPVESTSISIANNWLVMGSPYEERCFIGSCIGVARLFDLNRVVANEL